MRETSMEAMIREGISFNAKRLDIFFEQMLCDLFKSCKVKQQGGDHALAVFSKYSLILFALIKID